jgi:hypothetical protein
MKLKRLRFRQALKGQSFIELALVLTLILLLLSGVIEFGALLNEYINVVDGAREGARWGAGGDDPFIRTTLPFGDRTEYYTNIDEIIEGKTPGGGALAPIALSAANGDDVVISVFSISGTQVVRYPGGSYWRKYKKQVSTFTNAQIQTRLDGSAPDTGMVLVEIFYHYYQILAMPWFTTFVHDPITVHTYSMMPVSAAEPTPTPIP